MLSCICTPVPATVAATDLTSGYMLNISRCTVGLLSTTTFLAEQDPPANSVSLADTDGDDAVGLTMNVPIILLSAH